MFKLIFRICALAAVLVAAPAVSAPDPVKFRAAVDSYIVRELAEQKVPGAAVAVLRNGEIILAKGYGLANVEHDVPVTRDTIFQSGSIGKMFTSAVILRQVELGKIGLDDPVSKYLPDAPAAWRAITVRHLLTHTSGIPNHGEEFDYRRDYTDEELAKSAYALPLDFVPGARWSYSNTAYILLGIIVNKATGRSYLDLLATDVFQPTGMKTARGISDNDIVRNRAAGYQLAGGELKNHDFVSPTMNATADGSLYFSLNDMIAWARAVEKGQVLGAESWKQAYAPVRLNSGKPYPYGFGWFIDEAGGKPHLHHGGAWQGFRTHYSRYLGDGVSIIVLANSASARSGKLAKGVAELWDAKLVAPGPRPKAEPALEPRVTALIERARSGTLRNEDLPLAGKGFAAAANQYFPPIMKSYGALQSLELIERREMGDDIVYTYRAAFANQAANVTYGVAPGNQVSSFMIAP